MTSSDDDDELVPLFSLSPPPLSSSSSSSSSSTESESESMGETDDENDENDDTYDNDNSIASDANFILRQTAGEESDDFMLDVYGDGEDDNNNNNNINNINNNSSNYGRGGPLGDIEYRLQTSIFYVEPVTHITCQLMFIDSASNALAQIDTRVMRLATPNTVDRFDIGRVIKASRYAPDGTLKFRLGSLFVYNAHVSPAQLSLYVAKPDAFSFVTPLTSISNFTIKPTMACFHSLNSLHIILHSLGVVTTTPTPIHAGGLNSKPNSTSKPKPKPKPKPNSETRRTVTITKTALATRRNKHNNNKNSGIKYRPR